MLKILDVSIEFSLTNSHHLDADYLTYIKALKYWAAIEGNISYGQKTFYVLGPQAEVIEIDETTTPRASKLDRYIFHLLYQSLKKGSRT